MSTTNPFESPAYDDFDNAVAAPMSIADVLFSFEGRIGRATYWMAYLGTNVVTILLMFALTLTGVEEIMVGGMLLLMIPLCWIGLAIQIKRWHDRDKSGWWMLIGLIPYIGGLWALIECGFLPGTPGRNTYGADPVGY